MHIKTMENIADGAYRIHKATYYQGGMVMRAFYAYIVFCIVVMISIGCSTPYQKKNAMGNGYHDYIIEPNVYLVSFEGNRWTDADTVAEYWHRRATELCGGTGKYEIIVLGGHGGTAGPFFEEYHRREGRIRCK